MNERRKIVVTPTAYSIHAEGDNPLLSEFSIKVKVEDNGDGPYLVLTEDMQHVEALGQFTIDFEELEMVMRVARYLKKFYKPRCKRT